ncbi:PREDICTED: probable NAD(P)H dehydrogenase subunit CRR3, chloroplastic [Camelina sativa]|uniref:Probable NAD(P)H dehydrogenase subunit CRR3, chloroplastic n=1 Tax=Camelina sativa TaxID=90675 RepID=A0ABM0YJW8_CAMSA|nr:PREDICTED: probable NAD(P)H dehydrogenase subunit CRR3, chloroplastic [Camelina sativa]
MAVLSTIFSVTTRASTPPIASLANDSPSPLPSSSSPSKKPAKLIKVSKQMGNQNQQLRKLQRRGNNKPSIAQIERAFGSGSYLDSEGEMDMNTVFDELLLGHTNKFEGKIEKKLREIGEIFVAQTETKLRSSGKQVLMFTIQWILPIWIMSLLVACGAIKLPFSLPLLDDLIM